MSFLSSLAGAFAMPFVGSSALALGGLGADIWAGRESGQDERAFNERQAQLSRDFQERMSSTAYQRAMEDMKLAGLNPMLAFEQGGASTPSGAAAAAGRAATGSFPASVSAAVSAVRAKAEIDLLKQQARKTGNEATILGKEVPKADVIKDIWEGVSDIYQSTKSSAKYASEMLKTFPLVPKVLPYRQAVPPMSEAQRESLRRTGRYTRPARNR